MKAPESVADLDLASIGAVGDYVAECITRRLMPNTVLQKHAVLTRIQREIGLALEKAGRDQVRIWWRHLCRARSPRTGLPLANATVGNYLTNLREFYKWALDEGLCDTDPTRGIKAPPRRRGTPRDVDVPTAITAVTAITDRETRTACWLALYAGLRRSELVTVKRRNLIRRGDGHVLVVVGKGGVRRNVPLPEWLAAEIRACPAGWLLPSPRSRSGHLTPDHFGKKAAKALRAFGLDSTLHPLRHTFGTAAYEATSDVRAVGDAMGHKSINTTSGYVRGGAAAIARVADGLHGGRPTPPAPPPAGDQQ